MHAELRECPHGCAPELVRTFIAAVVFCESSSSFAVARFSLDLRAQRRQGGATAGGKKKAGRKARFFSVRLFLTP
jgi:hypothetical protein